MKGLREIQQGLKVAKGQRNNFGNYSYRSTSDILEALKPLLSEFKCSILMSDQVLEVGNRNYVEATVKLISDDGAIIETTALACEPEIQKGMAASQITGTASSYARKYALSGLFAIDDTDEVDSHDNTKVDYEGELKNCKTEAELGKYFKGMPSDKQKSLSKLTSELKLVLTK